MEKNNIPEEVTITPIIKDLEKLVTKTSSIIISTFTFFFRQFLNFINFNIKQLKFIIPIVTVGAVIGFSSMKYSPRNYVSTMVVELNVDAREQLSADIAYFNALIKEGNTARLTALFNISPKEASTLSRVQLNAHSSYLERVDFINSMYKNLDTATHKHLDYDALLKERNPALSNKFEIMFFSTDQKLFEKLEAPTIKFLERVPELQKMKTTAKRVLEYKRDVLLNEMANLDTLKKVLNKVIIEQARSNSGKSTGTSISLGQEQRQSGMTPLDVYNKYMHYSEQVADLERDINKYTTCYNIFAHVNDTGTKYGYGKFRRAAVVGSTFLILLYLTFIVIAIINKSKQINA